MLQHMHRTLFLKISCGFCGVVRHLYEGNNRATTQAIALVFVLVHNMMHHIPGIYKLRLYEYSRVHTWRKATAVPKKPGLGSI